MNYFSLNEIKKDIKRGKYNDTTMKQMVSMVCEKRLGCGLYKKEGKLDGRLIRVSTPLDQVKPAEVPSPSESKADSISLPSASQMKRDKDKQKAFLEGKEEDLKSKSHRRTQS